MIRLEEVSFSYGSNSVLKGINHAFKRQGNTAIIGYSGSGKTTLLHLLGGLLPCQQGKIVMTESDDVPTVGIVMQDFGLLPWKTVLDNVALGVMRTGISIEKAREKAYDELVRLGISDIEIAYPTGISGGQKQRVAIARTLIQKPSIVLFDEASSALDALTKEVLQDLILELQQKEKFTLIFVTHSIEEAVYLGQEILILNHGRLQTVVANPLSGTSHYRQTEAYFKNCIAVRTALESGGV